MGNRSLLAAVAVVVTGGAVTAVAAAPARVSSSPSGQVAVIGNKGDYLVSVRSGKLRRLRLPATLDPPALLDASWSPDGRRLLGVASTGRRGLSLAVEYLDLVSGKLRRVSPAGDRTVASPSWSPDGKRVAYALRHPKLSDGVAIVVIGRDGRGREVIESQQDVSTVRWSPDGRAVAYAALIGDRYEVRAIAPDGSGDRTLDVTQASSLSWSGDGGRVAYANTRSQVAAARADGSGTRVLTLTATSRASPDFHDDNVSWQPTGSRILFIRRVGDAAHPERLGIVDADSGAERVLVTRYGVEAACWSPDGRWIAYIGVDARTGNPSSVWVVRSDGSSNHRIAAFPPEILVPYAIAWRPTTA